MTVCLFLPPTQLSLSDGKTLIKASFTGQRIVYKKLFLCQFTNSREGSVASGLLVGRGGVEEPKTNCIQQPVRVCKGIQLERNPAPYLSHLPLCGFLRSVSLSLKLLPQSLYAFSMQFCFHFRFLSYLFSVLKKTDNNNHF